MPIGIPVEVLNLREMKNEKIDAEVGSLEDSHHIIDSNDRLYNEIPFDSTSNRFAYDIINPPKFNFPTFEFPKFKFRRFGRDVNLRD